MKRFSLLSLILLSSYQAHSESAHSSRETNCNEVVSSEQASFANQIASLAVANESYLAMPEGYLLHRTCIQQFGASFSLLIKDSLREGFECLRGLGTTKSSKNLSAFENLLHSKTLQVSCDEGDYHWYTGAAAHGSSSHETDKPAIDLRHPFISFSPNYNLNPASKNSISPLFLKAVIFHELFHNIGYRHGLTVDYPYACEDCCSSELSNEGKHAACKVCGTDYKGIDDVEYLKDLSEWSKYTDWKKSLMVPEILKLALAKNPGNEKILKMVLMGAQNTDALSMVFAKKLYKNQIISKKLFSSLGPTNIPHSLNPILGVLEGLSESREEIFIKGNVKRGLDYLDKVDFSPLRSFLQIQAKDSREYRLAFASWESILSDLDALEESGKLNLGDRELFNKTYKKIKESKP